MSSRFSPAILLVAGATGLFAPASRAEDGAQHPTAPDAVRFAPRRSVEVPADARFDVLDPHRRATSFASEIDLIVAQMTSALYTQRLGQLCGEYTAPVGGDDVVFSTRYSLGPQAALSWQYGLEMLDAAGWDVHYQDYTHSGHALKNVVATKLGTVTPERIYVLGGHIDSTSPQPTTLAPGAEDNGSGSAAVLTAALVLSGYDFDSTIELVLFSGEEQGLWGSQAYVADALAQGRDVRAAVTFDMISYHTNEYGVLIEGETAWTSLMLTVADAVDAYTNLDRSFSYFSFGSDHVPFQNANIPAILAIDLDWDEYPYYHRTTDTFDKTDPDFAVKIARAGTAAIAHLAGIEGASVDVPQVPAPVTLAVHPNPAVKVLRIDLDGSGISQVEIFDLGGRLVRRLAVPAASAPFHLVWDLTDAAGAEVPAGVYFVRAGRLTERLVTLR